MIRVHIALANGEDRDEEWPSLDAFLAWAGCQPGPAMAWRAYAPDPEDPDPEAEWMCVAQGKTR